MPDPTEELREHPSTYLVQDHSNQEDMTRLEFQDRMLTTGMGGVWPELADHSRLQKVLDVGCGTGGWLIEAARTYPTIERLVGVDVSNEMLTYARDQAKAQQLDGRVEFQTMDALRMLEFPPASFDLINQRLGVSWLRTSDWTKLLLEYQRVCRPGGIIRITESDIIENNSPALTKLFEMILKVMYNSGRFFTESRDGVTGRLVPLMTQHGIQDVQTRVHTLVYRAGTIEHQSFYQDTLHGLRLMLPFLQKWIRVPDETYQQALTEMQQPDFVATWTFLTVWGTKPMNGDIPIM